MVEITCRELVELVTEYLEGAMEPSERARLDEHLSGCRSCRHYLKQMRGTIKTVGQLREESVTPEAQDALLDVFRAWKQNRPV
jgi:predicted anti-sigma-YlaC factor YlaD